MLNELDFARLAIEAREYSAGIDHLRNALQFAPLGRNQAESEKRLQQARSLAETVALESRDGLKGQADRLIARVDQLERALTQSNEAPAEASSWSRRRWLSIGLVVAILVIGAGVGAYLYGKSTGEDLGAVRVEGTQTGKEQGSAEGAEEGYAKGFEVGRSEGYEASYADAYRAAYAEAFNEAGLKPPKKIKVPQP